MKSSIEKQIEIIEGIGDLTPLEPDEPEDYHYGWRFGEHDGEEWHMMNREPFLFIYMLFDAPLEIDIDKVREVLNYSNWKSDWGFSACNSEEDGKLRVLVEFKTWSYGDRIYDEAELGTMITGLRGEAKVVGRMLNLANEDSVAISEAYRLAKLDN
jgi:hypothetical protein